MFKSIVLYFFAGIQIVSPLWQAVWFGYDSIGLFLWDLVTGLAGAYLCRILADCLKRLDRLEHPDDREPS